LGKQVERGGMMKKGDVIINGYAGDKNPIRKLIYIGENNAITIDNKNNIKKYKISKDNDRLRVISHSKEYDKLVEYLRRLRGVE
jgi:hypothetical protein